MSLCIDASGALALHFADEAEAMLDLEDRLANGEEALTATNFFPEVMEGLRRGIREGRTTEADALAWLSVLDTYQIKPLPAHPVSGCSTWQLAARMNVSAYDAAYAAVAYAHGQPLWTRDEPLRNKLKLVKVNAMP